MASPETERCTVWPHLRLRGVLYGNEEFWDDQTGVEDKPLAALGTVALTIDTVQRAMV